MNNDNDNPANPNKRSMDIESQFKSLVKNINEYFPFVDEILILDILRLEYFKPNWQGTTTIEIQYRKVSVNLEEKKDRLYDKFNMLPMEKDERTLRFKAKKMYLRDIEEFFDNDSDIEHITGSARSTEEDQYPSSQ
jgi:lipopolysaccharide assembly outer membrane protein LptD (OstA)